MSGKKKLVVVEAPPPPQPRQAVSRAPWQLWVGLMQVVSTTINLASKLPKRK